LNPSSSQQPRNTKIATFGKSHQISTECPKLFRSFSVIEKKQIYLPLANAPDKDDTLHPS